MELEKDVIRKVAAKHAQVVDAAGLRYKAVKDPYGTLMAVVKELKSLGWTSGWICGESDSPDKHITVFPPGQKAEARGQYFRAGEQMARRYCIHMAKAPKKEGNRCKNQ